MTDREQRPQAPEDDGRVVAPMNVDGMPWYQKDSHFVEEGAKRRSTLSRKDKRMEDRAVMVGVVKAALCVAGFFIAGYTIFFVLITAACGG